MVELALVVMRLKIVAEATVRSEIVVVASVVVPNTVKVLATVEVPAKRSTKLPFKVPKLVVKKFVVVALVIRAFRAKRLVVVLFVVEAFVATKLVEVEKMKFANDEKRFVEEASVLKSVVDVLLVITDEEARSVPVSVRVLRAER